MSVIDEVPGRPALPSFTKATPVHEGEWRRSQTTRTAGETPFEVALLDTEPPPIYQRISQQATQLQALGLSLSCIARKLGVNGKTAAKAVRWVERIAQDRQR